LGSEAAFLSSYRSDEKDLITNFHEADLDSYSIIKGRYFYGNGDYYTFSGTVNSNFGGGGLQEGEKIYAHTSAHDAFDKGENETGNAGYYLIDAVTNKVGTISSSIVIEDYYDHETSRLSTVFSAAAGSKGLGSETATLTSANTFENDQISSFHEADYPSYYWEISGKYFYGNGDYYTLKGFINDEHTDGNLGVGSKIYAGSDSNDSFFASDNELGLVGFYELDSISKAEGSTDKGLLISSYHDSESLLTIRPFSSSQGLRGLGSEFGWLTHKKKRSLDYIDSVMEADIGFSSLESVGNASLLQDHDDILFVRDRNQIISGIAYLGKQVSSQAFKGWSVKGAETINGVNKVAWQHSSGNISIWNTDSNWNYASSAFHGSATSAQGFQAETNFGIDFNGDGLIGLSYFNEERKGNVDLVIDSAGGAYARSGAGVLDDITYGGVQVSNGYFAGWSVRGAETINGVNQVAWQHSSSNISIWNTDANWNYTSSAFYGLAASAHGVQAEINFGLDFNGDQAVGLLV